MLVEVVGPCGAGKTTLLPRLAAACDGQVVNLLGRRTVGGQVQSRLKRWTAWVWVLVSSPPSTMRVLRHVTPRRYAMRRALEAMQKARWMRRLDHRDALLIVDEGPLHLLALALAMSKWDGDAKALPRFSYPDLVLLVDTPAAVATRQAEADGGRDFFAVPGLDPTDVAESYRRVVLSIAREIKDLEIVVSPDPDQLIRGLQAKRQRRPLSG